ncbi:MAG TPA: membrane protein insertase YidC [Candidatus Acidoferrales bacterium]|nr:membrane protein insertase YidC [Candidatus Acidoferrales bacterium]
MSDPQQKGVQSPEMRILGASLLSMLVILLWIKYFAPKPPVVPPQPKPVISAPQTPSAVSPAPGSATTQSSSAKSPSTSKPVAAISDSQESSTVVQSDLYRVEISNRGAVVKSWQLNKYMDDNKPSRVLDVVHPEAAQQIGGWPFSLILDNAELEKTANNGLFKFTSANAANANPITAPADVQFSWSDGHLEITKHFHFDNTYVVRVDVTAKLDGKPLEAGLAWLGGFGDLTVTNPAPVETVTTYYSENGKIVNFPYKKLEGLDHWGPGVWQGGKDFTGIEDRYFTAAFLPPNGAASGTLQTRYWKDFHPAQINGQPGAEPVPEVATASGPQALALRVYVGPKDYDELKHMNPPLHGLVNFGWMEFIADPLFHALKWLHKYIPNWGWAIVILTLVINMALFPLRISSYKTTMKMQRVGPEIKAIQERYKKYKLNDPRKAEMNKEVMAVYSREGINPAGGCFQMFLQMPIWFGLNNALRFAIEMRHARWFGWITDLSARDPYYVLPVMMGLSMYLVSKMTPMTSTDPQQQMMMKIMPVTMAGIFMISPISSGLAVYILTSSIVGIGQQWYLNRHHPVIAAPVTKPVRGKKS